MKEENKTDIVKKIVVKKVDKDKEPYRYYAQKLNRDAHGIMLKRNHVAELRLERGRIVLVDKKTVKTKTGEVIEKRTKIGEY